MFVFTVAGTHHVVCHEFLVLVLKLVGVLGGVISKVVALKLPDGLLHRHVPLGQWPLAEFFEIIGDFYDLPVAGALGREVLHDFIHLDDLGRCAVSQSQRLSFFSTRWFGLELPAPCPSVKIVAQNPMLHSHAKAPRPAPWRSPAPPSN